MSEETQKELKKLDAAKAIMNSAQKNLSEMFGGIEKIIDNTKNVFSHLEHEKAELESIKSAQQQQITGLTDKQQQILKEYEQLKGELEKWTKLAAGEEGEVKIEDMQATLIIYRTLLEQIWQSQAHAKILYLLHDHNEMTTQQLKDASGIQGAMVLRACQELARASLIGWDEMAKKAKLIKRLFPKRERKLDNIKSLPPREVKETPVPGK